MKTLLDPVLDEALSLGRAPLPAPGMLGLPFVVEPATTAMRYAKATIAAGLFANAELRVNVDTGLGLLLLQPRGVVLQGDLRLERLGHADVRVQPKIMPEGTDTWSFGERGQPRLRFEMTSRSRRLLLVSLEWPPATD